MKGKNLVFLLKMVKFSEKSVILAQKRKNTTFLIQILFSNFGNPLIRPRSMTHKILVEIGEN
jgi:hypothetical protein